jgi:hypothetical protein
MLIGRDNHQHAPAEIRCQAQAGTLSRSGVKLVSNTDATIDGRTTSPYKRFTRNTRKRFSVPIGPIRSLAVAKTSAQWTSYGSQYGTLGARQLQVGSARTNFHFHYVFVNALDVNMPGDGVQRNLPGDKILILDEQPV